MKFHKDQSGFSIVGLILALAIVSLLYYLSLRYYFKGPVVDNKTKQGLAEQGINTDNYSGITKTAQDKVGELNKKSSELGKELEKKIE